ncbi:putative phosphoribosylformylglycinamidine cyclo-ligase [Helianthus annuus]|nr:putative phosphoribosylformylglycinamidine cyclo-ligase [Helianthus annuus]KAJ0927939.1 putative phosphoribosylformylglycinamidine cyclo-ligase [Helianthus annuus]
MDGNIEDAEMKRTFNMGIRMVLVTGEEAAQRKEDKDSRGVYKFIMKSSSIFFDEVDAIGGTSFDDGVGGVMRSNEPCLKL